MVGPEITYVKVTPATRFAFAWTNLPTQTRNGLVVVPPVGRPVSSKNLGWRQLIAVLAECKWYNSGNDWACSVWVREGGVYRRLAWTLKDVEWWLTLWQCDGPSQTLDMYVPLETQ